MAKSVANGLAFVAVATLPPAASNVGVVMQGPNGNLFFSDGTIWNSVNELFPSTSIVASSAAINTAESYVTAAFKLDANVLQPGMKFRVTLYGNFTSTSVTAATTTFTTRIGSAGTVADAAIITLAATGVGAMASAVPFKYEADITIRSVGASGTAIGSGFVFNSGTASGVSAANSGSAAPANVAVNTTGNLFLGVSVKTSATTANVTITQATIEHVN